MLVKPPTDSGNTGPCCHQSLAPVLLGMDRMVPRSSGGSEVRSHPAPRRCARQHNGPQPLHAPRKKPRGKMNICPRRRGQKSLEQLF